MPSSDPYARLKARQALPPTALAPAVMVARQPLASNPAQDGAAAPRLQPPPDGITVPGLTTECPPERADSIRAAPAWARRSWEPRS